MAQLICYLNNKVGTHYNMASPHIYLALYKEKEMHRPNVTEMAASHPSTALLVTLQ